VEGKHSRKEIRLPNYDYSSPGWYFVTICTKDSKRLFYPTVSKKYGYGETGAPRAGPYGNSNGNVFVGAGSYPARDINLRKEHTRILEMALEDLETKFYKNLNFDFYAIMPNHLHLIVVFEDIICRIQGRAPTL
jgi:putative transposase